MRARYNMTPRLVTDMFIRSHISCVASPSISLRTNTRVNRWLSPDKQVWKVSKNSFCSKDLPGFELHLIDPLIQFPLMSNRLSNPASCEVLESCARIITHSNHSPQLSLNFTSLPYSSINWATRPSPLQNRLGIESPVIFQIRDHWFPRSLLKINYPRKCFKEELVSKKVNYWLWRLYKRTVKI